MLTVMRPGQYHSPMPKPRPTFAARPPTPAEILRLREDAGMTQAQFAEAVGVSVRTVKFWEAGDRKPSGPVLILFDMLRQKNPPK